MNISRVKNSSLIFIKKPSFCTKNNNQEDQKRYNHEFENPEEKNLTMNSIIYSLVKFLLKFGFISLFVYVFFMKKYNELTKKREPYFFNEFLENWISKKQSKYIQELLKYQLYSDDTEEVARVKEAFDKLLTSNNIISKQNQVFVVGLPCVGCYLLKNGDLFVSTGLLDLAKNQEELSFFLAHEISLLVNGQSFSRFCKSVSYYFFFHSKLGMNYYHDFTPSSNDYFKNKLKELKKLKFFLNFYPESPIITFPEHIRFFRTTLKLLSNAKLDHEKAISGINRLESQFTGKYSKTSLSGNNFNEYRYYNGLLDIINDK